MFPVVGVPEFADRTCCHLGESSWLFCRTLFLEFIDVASTTTLVPAISERRCAGLFLFFLFYHLRALAEQSKSSLPPESSSSMAVGNGSSNVESQERKRRRKCPGVRVVGKRIYDSEHGKSCHQCRQKTMEFTVTCKKLNKDKPCTLKFCHNCLLKRYGEEAEEVDKLEDWSCPKCRDVCNCSFCMKRKGCQPTGPLTHTAKQIGFRSVHEFLDHHKDFKALNSTALVEVPSATPDSSPSYQGLEGSKRSC